MAALPHAGTPIEILMIDDDAGDILIAREALTENKVRNNVSVVNDGVEALRYLHGDDDAGTQPRPDLILLDLNLPRKGGLEVLAEIKADPSLRRIPVVVLTTSEAEEDIARSYDLHANAYVTKPVDFRSFLHAVRQIDDFFVTIVKLPSR